MDIIGDEAMMILLYVVIGLVVLIVLGLLISSRKKLRNQNENEPGAGYIVESEEVLENAGEEVKKEDVSVE